MREAFPALLFSPDNTRNFHRNFESLELKIAETEKRQAEIETQLSVQTSDASKVHELFVEQQKLNMQFENDMERWAELAEKAG